MASEITYPLGMTDNLDKLSAVYRLLEEMRIEHNRVGATARADWDKHEGRWQTYKELFAEKQSPLLIEMRQLKDILRKASYTDVQWEDRDDLTDEDYDALWGDKATLKEIPTLATTPLLAELKAIDFLGLDGVFVDPLEDWTTYTEVDTSNVLSVAANTITVTALTRTSDSWVYKDHGASHFGTTGVDHDIEVTGTDFNGSNPSIYFWALANQNNPVQGTDPIIWLRMQDVAGTDMRIRLELDDGATDENDASGVLSLATPYYLTITREAGGTDCKIYDDSGRTSLVDTISVSQGTTAFQFMVNAFSASGSGTEESNGFIDDLDLNEVAVGIAVLRRRYEGY